MIFAVELQRIQHSYQYWVESALEQLHTVQQVATACDGLEVHSWPDDDLVRATRGQLRATTQAMQEAVSAESFDDETAPPAEQSELAADLTAVR